MIYIFCNSAVEATRYARHTLLQDFHIVELGAPGPELHENDEVFILSNASTTQKQLARRQYGAVFPRPHLFKEVEPAPIDEFAALVT